MQVNIIRVFVAVHDIFLLYDDSPLLFTIILTCYNVGKQQRVDVRSDVGAFVGTFLPEAWEILFPSNISSTEFFVMRKRMGGFGEASKSFPLSVVMSSSSSPKAADVGVTNSSSEVQLIGLVKKILNVFLVQGAGVGELLFAGCSRKGMMEEKLLVTVTSDRFTFIFCIIAEIYLPLNIDIRTISVHKISDEPILSKLLNFRSCQLLQGASYIPV